MHNNTPKEGQECTYQDYLTWTEDERWEVINGKARQYNPFYTNHSRVITDMICQIYEQLRPSKEYEVISRIVTKLDDSNVVEPDILILKSSKINEIGTFEAPDMIIEVATDNDFKEYCEKLILYRTFGVQEYWIVNYDRKHIIAYDFVHKDVKHYNFTDKVTVTISNIEVYVDFSKIEIRDFTNPEER